ncbi:MAG: glycosyltransferase family 2 protein [Fibrobacteria bacterium]
MKNAIVKNTPQAGESTVKEIARLIVLMPMRNEIGTIESTLKSLAAQTVKPELLLVLADGVGDGSDRVVERFAAQHAWIELERLPDRGFDNVGKGVAQVLNKGIRRIEDRQSEFLAKVDADVELPPDYFERVLRVFENNPRQGMVSGHPFTIEAGRKILERHGDRFPSGTARVYRRDYLEKIGYWVPSVGWDTVDILRMRMRGFEVLVLHDLEYHHIRRMGTRNGYMDGMLRDGRNAYLTGYAPWFFLLRAVFNGIYRPYLLRTACMLAGYTAAWCKRLPRTVSAEEMAFHRKSHRERFLKFHPLQP